MPSAAEYVLLAGEEDLRSLRGAVVTAAERVGMRELDRTKLATAALELGRNAVLYGGGGSAEVRELERMRNGRDGVHLVVEDQGRGIADVAEAMSDGYSSQDAPGLGLGLGGARRLVDVFVIDSEPDVGTRVEVIKWA